MISVVESAILLEVSEAEPLVGALRLAGDASAARGVPAHVTLLYPFVDDPDPGVVEELRFFFERVEGFDLDLASVGSWPEVVYLELAQPEVVHGLIAALVRRWPQCPPYGGLFDVADVVPHLTVVDTPDPELRSRAAEQVAGGLPIRARVRHASLWAHGGDDRWTELARFPLAESE